jgi:hypothetical protein
MEGPEMLKTLPTLVATALACLTLAGCVSESGYTTYDRGYTRYDGPSYIYRTDRPRRDWDRRHHNRRDWDRHREARRDDHRSRRDWDRGDHRREDRRDSRPHRDGRPSRDGRIWTPDN